MLFNCDDSNIIYTNDNVNIDNNNSSNDNPYQTWLSWLLYLSSCYGLKAALTSCNGTITKACSPLEPQKAVIC